MRKRLSYANVTATLALVFAMSGGAMAANSYLINSTKQINPKVLKKLKGSAGKAGANGASGATGATGATGAQGPGGKEGTPGKEGSPGKEGATGQGPAFGAFRDGAVAITSTESSSPTVIATLTGLPAGSYEIQAKTVGDDENATEDFLTCTLTAGSDVDTDGLWTSREQAGDVFRSVFALEVLHTFSAAGGTAQVACYSSNNTTELKAEDTKIIAVQLSSLTNKAVSE